MRSSMPKRIFQSLLIPALAVFTALIVGAIIMWLSGDNPIEAYIGLFQGAFGRPQDLAETIRRTTPLILTGLSVAVAFKAGLFNIGASGQFIMGMVFSVAVVSILPVCPHSFTCRWRWPRVSWVAYSGVQFPVCSRVSPVRTK